MTEALNDLIAVLERFRSVQPAVDTAGSILLEALRAGGKILTCGNGGSAADAAHMSEELVGRYKGERRSLPAVCLSVDGALLTCIGNDYGFDALFSRQVEGLGKPGDVLVTFSTSGNSTNILNAIQAAKRIGVKVVSLIGKDGGKAKGLSDVDIIVPGNVTARIQEVHTFVMHCWLERIEAESW
jgi:D-sedoheptulose 7-phosphate isomerase